MVNAQLYMGKNDAYFTSTATIRFPYELRRLFDRVLRELQYIHERHPHAFYIGFGSVA